MSTKHLEALTSPTQSSHRGWRTVLNLRSDRAPSPLQPFKAFSRSWPIRLCPASSYHSVFYTLLSMLFELLLSCVPPDTITHLDIFVPPVPSLWIYFSRLPFVCLPLTYFSGFCLNVPSQDFPRLFQLDCMGPPSTLYCSYKGTEHLTTCSIQLSIFPDKM